MTLLVGVFALIFGGFLREQSYKYMVDNIYYTEEAVLHVVNKDIRGILSPIIGFGIESAVSTQMAASVQEYEADPDGMTMRLTSLLKSYQFPDDVAAIAVVGEKGVIAEYDRYRYTTRSISMWNEGNAELLGDLYREAMTKYSDFRSLNMPKYFCVKEPAVHPAHSWMRVFHIVFPVLQTNGEEIRYILIMTVKRNALEDELAMVEAQQRDAACAFIVDGEDEIVFSGAEAVIGEKIGRVKALYPGMDRLMVRDIGLFGWKIYVYLNEGKIRKSVDEIYERSYYLYGLLLLIFVLFAVLFTRRLLRPVNAIRAAMQKLNYEEEPSLIEIRGSHELWQLTAEYNYMVKRLEEKTREVEAQHREAILSLERAYDAEREALESQINAHFLCNTIGVINYEAIEAGDRRVSLLLKKLSNILRYTFERKAQIVYIGQEIAWTEQYLYLQKERFGELFDYSVETDETYDDWPACKLMLQPFVENSILHGFRGRKQGGIIRITTEIDQTERLCLTVSDNGCGMSGETRERIRASIEAVKGERVQKEKPAETELSGVGIRNVLTRMSAFYGPELAVEFSSDEETGTHFAFRLPYPEEGSGHENRDCRGRGPRDAGDEPADPDGGGAV